MTKVDYLLLCEGATSDSEERWTLVNIFDCVTSTKLPVEIKKLVVAFSVTAEESELPSSITLKIQFLNPSGKLILESTGEAERLEQDPLDPDKRLKVTTSVDFSGTVPFREFGTYKYRLLIDDIEMQTNDLEILKKTEV